MEGDLIQGTLQSLLQNRQQLQQNQQRAQQQQLSTMRTPLPQTGPIEQMVSDYLTKYAANPGMGWSAAASAIGGQAERSRKMDESQLLRMQAADEAEAKMAGDALKEQDLFAGRLSVSKAVSGKQPSPEQLRTVYTSSLNHFSQIAKDLDFNKMNPSDPGGERSRWIQARTDEAVQNYIDKFATQPLGPRGLGEAATQSEQGTPGSFQKLEPLPTLPKLGEAPTTGAQPAPTLPPTTQDENANRNIALIQQELQRPEVQKDPNRKLVLEQELQREREALKNAKPQTAQAGLGNPLTQGVKTPSTPLENSQTGMPAPQQAPVVGAAGAAKPPAKDAREISQVKSYGKEEGQELFKERKALDSLYGANSKLIGQLNLLENIYKNPNIPEGELAGQISAFRSGMKSLGIEVSDQVGMTDLAKAVSTGLALTQRTADGTNLLPGAMSNYEDQLLQKMAPTLTLTTEGRLALIQFMKQVAQSNLRYAEEGTKMASENKNMLPAEWYKRKERIMLEEMARMKMASEQLLRQYGGKR